jgi:two-component system nitrogen regulation response regulator GlnG
MIADGTFRRDLFYRLRGVTLTLPPLRDRQEDIAELAHYFLFRFNRQLGTAAQAISPEALEKLQSYNWPGNIRELQSVIREAMIVSMGPTLLPEFLPIEFRAEMVLEPEPASDITAIGGNAWWELGDFISQSLVEGRADLYREALQRFDRLIVTEAMQRARGLQSRAAELLALSRPTIRAKLRSFIGSPADAVADAQERPVKEA